MHNKNIAMRNSLPVLLVEDEELMLAFLQSALERAGIRVLGALTGAEAIAKLQQGEFAGVVSDLFLPGEIDGGGILEWVRQYRPALGQRFLFITGNIDDPRAVDLRQHSGVTFLEKPFRIAMLVDWINRLMIDVAAPLAG